jgi:peptide/nickel transport system substrate-binding protein
MRGFARHCRFVVLSLVLLSLACTSPPPPTSETGVRQAAGEAPAAEPRTLVMAVRSEANSAAARLFGAASFNATPSSLFNAGLANKDQRDVASAYLSEALPQLNTDSWRVTPDGRMETRYTLKPNLTWHDGTALTADDFAFAWQVYATPQLGSAGSAPINQMDGVVAPDPRTVVVQWRRTYPGAGALEDRDFQALPRHLLDQPFQQLSPDLFASLPFWTTEYIGLGPYRLERTEPGASLEARAFAGYVFGRPRIDRIRVVFISDANTVLANLLAGTVHISLANSLPFQQGTILKREWASRGGGVILASPSSSTPIRRTEHQLHPGRVAPGSRAILDVRVRQALAHAVDKDALNEAIFEGQGVMADTVVPFNLATFPLVERAIQKYPYDVRASEQLMADAGFVRGADGFFTSPSQGRFSGEIRVIASPQNESSMAIMAAGWRDAGFDLQQAVLSAAQARDQEVRTSFPSLSTIDGGTLEGLGTAGIPTPENHWTGSNRGSWSYPPFDRVVEAWSSSLDESDRTRTLVEMATIYSRELPSTPVWYVLVLTAHTSALRGPTYEAEGIHAWELS